MKKILITALAVLGTYTAATATDIKGTMPKNGGTYNLYNVGTKQFLSIEDGRLTLGGDKLEVKLELIEDTTTPGFFRIKTSDGTLLGANIWGAPSTQDGKYTEWRIEPAEGSTEGYIIASRNTEASASMYLYQNSVYNRIDGTPRVPAKEFEAAQWLLVDSKTPETAIDEVKTDELTNELKTEKTTGVHNIGGQQVRSTDNTNGLQEGIYIVNGKKQLLKK